MDPTTTSYHNPTGPSLTPNAPDGKGERDPTASAPSSVVRFDPSVSVTIKYPYSQHARISCRAPQHRTLAIRPPSGEPQDTPLSTSSHKVPNRPSVSDCCASSVVFFLASRHVDSPSYHDGQSSHIYPSRSQVCSLFAVLDLDVFCRVPLYLYQ